MGWLWFLLALFFDSNINYPLLRWGQRRKKKLNFNFYDDGLAFLGLFAALGAWAGINYALCSRDDFLNR